MGIKYTDIRSVRLSNRPLVDFTAADIKKMTSPDELASVLENGGEFPIGAVVDRCLELGVNVVIFRNHSYKNLYHFAAQQGDCVALKTLLDISSGPINEIDLLSLSPTNLIRKDTPLHYACAEGHLEAAKLLITRGANVNIPSQSRRPPLFEAIISKNKELFEYLLQAGANPMAIDPDGRNAIFIAAKKGNLELLDRLLAIGVTPFVVDGDGFSVLHIALEDAKPEIIQRLLTAGVDPNIPCGSAKMRPLDAACCFCEPSIVELMIRNGAICNYAPGVNGHTLYYWAISRKNVAVVKYLLSIGIDPNVPTINISNLESAIETKSIEMVDIFLSCGMNVNAPTSKGHSLLRHPIAEGDSAMVYRLLLAGIDPNYGSSFAGDSLLHLAVMSSKSNPAIIEALINHGAKVNMSDKRLWTPLHRACESGNASFVETLLRKGANPNLTNSDGDNPMDLANQEAVKVVLARYGGVPSSCITKFYNQVLCCCCNCD